MPAPAVYVLAIVGTFGAIFAFKEFVYEPHIAPHVHNFIQEYQASRRRRQEQRRPLIPVPNTNGDGDGDGDNNQQRPRNRRGPPHNPANGSDDDSDVERYGRPHGRRPHSGHGPGGGSDSTNAPWARQTMSGSGHVRRASESSSYGSNDIELEDLVAREVSEWRNEVLTTSTNTSPGGRALRLRRNVGANAGASASHALDESNHIIPYSPITPTRRAPPSRPSQLSPTLSTPPTHIIANPDSPISTASTVDTPVSGRRTLSVPATPSARPHLSPPLVPQPLQEPQALRTISNSVLFSTDHSLPRLPLTPPTPTSPFPTARDVGRTDLASHEHHTEASQRDFDDGMSISDLSSLVTSPPLPALPVRLPYGETEYRAHSPSELERQLPSPPSAPPTARPFVTRTEPMDIPSASRRSDDASGASSFTSGSYETAMQGSLPSSAASSTFTASSVDTLRLRSRSPPELPANLTTPTPAPASRAPAGSPPPIPPLPTFAHQIPSPPTSNPRWSAAANSASGPVSASVSPHLVPSLSQVYPQELDSEHGLVLLSPPSSRSESPFSDMGSLSPPPVGSPFIMAGEVGAGFGMGSGSGMLDQPPQQQEGEILAISRASSASPPGSTASRYLSFSSASSSASASPSLSSASLVEATQSLMRPQQGEPPAAAVGVGSSPTSPSYPHMAVSSPTPSGYLDVRGRDTPEQLHLSPRSMPISPTGTNMTLSDLDFMSDFDETEDPEHSGAALAAAQEGEGYYRVDNIDIGREGGRERGRRRGNNTYAASDSGMSDVSAISSLSSWASVGSAGGPAAGGSR